MYISVFVERKDTSKVRHPDVLQELPEEHESSYRVAVPRVVNVPGNVHVQKALMLFPVQ